MTIFKINRGMRDFLNKDAKTMKSIENIARKVAELYGYEEIITPVVESFDLLSAKTGEEIRSRMYAFKDLGGRKVALRPEFTASVARVVATTLKNKPRPLRLFCVGSLYRYDEPQHGRYREFWQSNYELIGTNKPQADAEILLLTNSLLDKVGLKNYAFKIGHVGIIREILTQENCKEEIQNKVMQLMDKKHYSEAINLLKSIGISKHCISTLQKLTELKTKNVFTTISKIGKYVKNYYKAVEAIENITEILNLIVESEKRIDLFFDASFVRGLEYYTGMIFEIFIPEINIALGGGGRYDKLIELFGGEPTSAVGVAHGIDRIMLAMQNQKILPKTKKRETVVIIPIHTQLKKEVLQISEKLRSTDLSVRAEVMDRKITKALEDADRRNISYAIIVGERELKERAVVIRNLKTREQRIIKKEDIAKTLLNGEI
jgi:histidyl-tRNA synthetase